MASIVKRPSGSYEIRFQDHNRKPRSVYVRETKKESASIAAKLEHLASRRRHNRTPDPEVDAWLAAIDDRLHKRLAKFGLVDTRAAAKPKPQDKLLGDWVTQYIAKRKTLADSTIESLTIAGGNLTRYFGDDRPLKSITAGDACDYREWLATEGNVRTKCDNKSLAENTVRRRIGRAREMFTAAIKHRLIKENPFDGLAANVNANEERQVFVSQDWADRCIKASPCESWRIIIALCRYGGLRRHESLLMQWDCSVNLAKSRERG